MGKPLKVVILGDSKDAQKAFDQIAKKAEETSGGFSKITEGLTNSLGPAAIAGAVAIAGGLAAKVFVDAFMREVEAEALTDKLAARLDLSEGEAAAAGELAATLYRDGWGESLGEVNDAIGSVMTRLGDLAASSDTTEAMVQDALTIADVWDQDVNEVIRSASALLSSDMVQSADQAFDVITTGLTEGADLNGDFLDSLFEYSTHFASAGISADQMLSGLIAGTDAGMMGVDKVGDAVKEMAIRLQDGSSLTRETLQGIGLDADAISAAFARGGDFAGEASDQVLEALAAMDDPLAQNQAAVALLGTPWEDLGAKGEEVLDALVVGVGDLRDTASVAETAYDNTATSLEGMKRKGLGAVQDLVAGILSGFGLGGEDGSIKSGIDALGQWFDENREEIREWGENAAEWLTNAWDSMKPLLESAGDFAAWLIDNSDEIAEWAGKVIGFFTTAGEWADVAFSSVQTLVAPLLDVWELIQDINEALGGSPKSTGTVSKGGSAAGGGSVKYFHGGGIFTDPSGEGWARLADGEGVFTRDQMAALGGVAGSGTTIVFEGPVYGFADFEDAVVRATESAARRGRTTTFLTVS